MAWLRMYGTEWTVLIPSFPPEIEYCHLKNKSICVSVGDRVTAGQQIGYMGSTGYSTGAHLHFQLEIFGMPTDPIPYILGEIQEAAGGGSEPDNTPADWAEEAVQWAQKNGILYGDENGNLRLHENCTREMMLVFLWRAEKLRNAKKLT